MNAVHPTVDYHLVTALQAQRLAAAARRRPAAIRTPSAADGTPVLGLRRRLAVVTAALLTRGRRPRDAGGVLTAHRASAARPGS